VPLLSAIVITRNEAGNIGECLDSIAFCDERIVIDCGSSDDTVAIARAKGATVAYRAWEGFGAQKNHALSLAAGDWVLSIDADERVTPQLAAAIKRAIEEGRADGYEFQRLSSFCGRPAGVLRVRDRPRACVISARLRAARGISRRRRGIFARGRQRRGQLLPLHEGVAGKAPSWLS